MMRPLLTLFLCLATTVVFCQSASRKDSVSAFLSPTTCSHSIDTFCLAGYNFKVPPNCTCLPNQLFCENGIVLRWYYYENKQEALQSLEKDLKSAERNMLSVKHRPITCMLLDTEVKGYYVQQVGRKETNTIYVLSVAGIVNGNAIRVELESETELNNTTIPEAVRALFYLKQ